MNLIQRFHEFVTGLGISPKVADPFLLGLLAVVVTWITSGSFDLDQVKLLAVTFAYGILGVAAPPVAGATQKAITSKAKSHGHR
jgi:hypothetical protein